MFEKMKIPFLIILLFSMKCFSQEPCKTASLPVVFVHGFLASGDTWSAQLQRFSSNGYCDNRLFVFDWNTLGGKAKNDSLLDVFINAVLQKTNSSKIDLVGHSAGGGLCYGYLKDSARAMKTAHYAHVGSSKMTGPAGYSGNVPTINIYSDGDKVLSGADVSGVTNIRQSGNDHLQVASGAETFAALYEFFTGGKKPSVVSIIPSNEDLITIAGRAVTLGENKPLKGAGIFIYEYDPVKGRRKNRTSPTALITDENGYWPSVKIRKGTYLELELHPDTGRVVSYFIEPPVRDNRNIYLRGITADGMAGALLRALPGREDQCAIAVFSSNQAIISGRDSVMAGDFTLSIPSLAQAGKTIIASFLFDDGDGISGGKPIKSFGPGIFFNGVDVMIPADKKKTFRIYFNGRSIALPCRAGKEAVMVAIFN